MENGNWKMEIGNAKWHGTHRPQCLLFCLASNWHRYSTMIYITTVYTCACTPISAYQSMRVVRCAIRYGRPSGVRAGRGMGYQDTGPTVLC